MNGGARGKVAEGWGGRGELGARGPGPFDAREARRAGGGRRGHRQGPGAEHGGARQACSLAGRAWTLAGAEHGGARQVAGRVSAGLRSRANSEHCQSASTLRGCDGDGRRGNTGTDPWRGAADLRSGPSGTRPGAAGGSVRRAPSKDRSAPAGRPHVVHLRGEAGRRRR